MPLGIVSEEDYQKEKNSYELDDKVRIDRTVIEKGRGEGTKEIPSVVREIVAESKLLGESNDEIKKYFKVSDSSISAYQHGNTSTASYHKKDSRLEKVRNNVSKRAGKGLLAALDAINNKDLNREEAKVVSGIAKDLASVFEKITPEIKKEKEQNVHLHLHVPKMKEVSDYEVIDVSSE